MKNSIKILFVFCMMVLCHVTVAQDISYLYDTEWKFEKLKFNEKKTIQFVNEYFPDKYKLNSKKKRALFLSVLETYFHFAEIEFNRDKTIKINSHIGLERGLWKHNRLNRKECIAAIELSVFDKLCYITFQPLGMNSIKVTGGDEFVIKLMNCVDNTIYIKRKHPINK